jgi:hypothetical protein
MKRTLVERVANEMWEAILGLDGDGVVSHSAKTLKASLRIIAMVRRHDNRKEKGK